MGSFQLLSTNQSHFIAISCLEAKLMLLCAGRNWHEASLCTETQKCNMQHMSLHSCRIVIHVPVPDNKKTALG